jgi:hypothetical protein
VILAQNGDVEEMKRPPSEKAAFGSQEERWLACEQAADD